MLEELKDLIRTVLDAEDKKQAFENLKTYQFFISAMEFLKENDKKVYNEIYSIYLTVLKKINDENTETLPALRRLINLTIHIPIRTTLARKFRLAVILNGSYIMHVIQRKQSILDAFV